VAAVNLVYTTIGWDDYRYGENSCRGDTGLYALFIANCIESNNHPVLALIIKETEQPNKWIRLGQADIHFGEYLSAMKAWEEVEGYEKPFPPDITQENQNKLIAFLETQTRVITLV
jgi:hypothetical protein